MKRSSLNLTSTCSVSSDCLKDKNGDYLSKKSTPFRPVCDFDNAEQCVTCVDNQCTCQTFDPYTMNPGAPDEFSGGRCSLCTAKEYYRESGECIKCPEVQPYQLALGGIFMVACAYSVYRFTKSGVSMALASIAIDYFQVLSMFSKTKIEWPQELKTLFKLLSIFNFNLDLFPPGMSFFFYSIRVHHVNISHSLTHANFNI